LVIAQVSVYSPGVFGAVQVCDAPRVDVGAAVLPLASGPNAKLLPVGHDHRYWSTLVLVVPLTQNPTGDQYTSTIAGAVLPILT